MSFFKENLLLNFFKLLLFELLLSYIIAWLFKLLSNLSKIDDKKRVI